MKLCPDCPTPEKCKAAGKCLKMPKKAMAKGGMSTKKKPDMMAAGMSKGGKVKKMGYAEGGMACGASNPPARPIK
jgi:hypothetical protein